MIILINKIIIFLLMKKGKAAINSLYKNSHHEYSNNKNQTSK